MPQRLATKMRRQPLVAYFTLAFLETWGTIILVIGLVLPSLGEEPGWRSFALPRLQRLYGLLLGSLVLGTLIFPGKGREIPHFAFHRRRGQWKPDSMTKHEPRRKCLMGLLNAAIAGLAGSTALTLVHETARRWLPDAPRADILGVRALEKGFFAAGEQPPTGDALHNLALGTDVVANAGYFALVAAAGRRAAWASGLVLGLLAGIGAITLPGRLGLGREPTERTAATRLMTVAWYTVGGAVAALVYRLLTPPPPTHGPQ